MYDDAKNASAKLVVQSGTLFGLERELLFDNGARIHDVTCHEIPGVAVEFFDCMVEVISNPHLDPAHAVAQIDAIVAEIESRGIRFHPFASYGHHDPYEETRWERVTSHKPYYEWIYKQACQILLEFHHVGIHVNMSNPGLTEDQMIRATNWLRALSFVFTLVSANSPLRLGRSADCLSRRSYAFPNRYDVPFWEDAAAFRAWIIEQEAIGRIYSGKARCWMTCCPRLEDNDVGRPISRIEYRGIDSGRNLPSSVIIGCCNLAERIMLEGASSSMPIPALLTETQTNDRGVAYIGRRAQVHMHGRVYSAFDIARDWCAGIPELEDVLENGSPAERTLRALMP